MLSELDREGWVQNVNVVFVRNVEFVPWTTVCLRCLWGGSNILMRFFFVKLMKFVKNYENVVFESGWASERKSKFWRAVECSNTPKFGNEIKKNSASLLESNLYWKPCTTIIETFIKRRNSQRDCPPQVLIWFFLSRQEVSSVCQNKYLISVCYKCVYFF